MRYAKECINSVHTFTRRLGFIIMLKLVGSDTIQDILSSIAGKTNESEYYVNMAIAWLLAECFTKCRNETYKFINTRHEVLSKFVINKAICKCRDSYRISDEDKEMLQRYRKK